MPAQETLLVVDDEEDIRDLLEGYLTGQGYDVLTAGDGTEMRRHMAAARIDLVLVDLGLPGEDGLRLTRYLREHTDVAVIIVTGKGEPVDRVVGLEVGADDYVAKPFDLRELLARIRSVLRRARPAGQTVDAILAPEVVRFAGWHLDLGGRRLIAPAGVEVPLTTGEFELLAAFVRSPNRVLSRDHLLEATRNREAGPFDRAIDVQVGRLRRKLESDPANPQLIKAVRGAGYIFTAPVERG
jgi:two-component system OmpR family response regulator